MKPASLFVFPPFQLDVANEQLWRDGQLLALPPKTFAVLRYLVENAGRLVTKEELFSAVWPDTRVSDGVLKGYIHDVREVLGDDPSAPRFIETVPRRGHRFIAPLTPSTPLSSSQRATRNTQHPALKTQDFDALIPTTHYPTPLLVGREAELRRLYAALEKAERGERQLVFIIGEPGIGKTTVVEAFLAGVGQRGTGNRKEEIGNCSPKGMTPTQLTPNARSLMPVSWIGRGQCVEHYGSGEAYLPVLEALGRIGHAPGGEQLITLLNQYAPTWLVQMPALLEAAELETLQRRVAGATRERMLREMVEAVDGLTAERTLVLWFEDLHWADYSTLDWLTAVAQRNGPARLLLLGTYRPADVSVSGHPLKAVKQELLARGQCEELWLHVLSSQEVAQYLTLRYPRNRFPEELRDAIRRSTDGNPLFLVNTIDYLAAQEVIADIDGQWQLRAPLAEVTQSAPESLRQLIEKHIERLGEDAQRLLEVASVVGREFSAAAAAACLETTTERVEEQCEDLVRLGQFLRAVEPRTLPDGTITGCYEFSHSLYRTVLYERAPTIRRVRLHRRIGEHGERTYGARAGEVAAELAIHFERGQDAPRAVKYLQLAAENVLKRYAHREAATYQQKALALLSTLPDTPEKKQEELTLQLALGVSLTVTNGFADPGVEQAYARARTLCQQIGDPPTLVPVLYGLWNFYLVRSQLQAARELADQLLAIAEREQEPAFLLAAHNAQTQTFFQTGRFAAARPHMERVLALYDPRTHNILAEQYGEDLGVSCRVFALWLLWQLGYPDQAVQHARTVKTIAEALSHPFSLAQALSFGGQLYSNLGAMQQVREMSDALLALCRERDFALWQASSMGLHGWMLVEEGREREGIVELRQGITDWRATGAEIWLPFMRAMLAEAYGKIEQPREGLVVIEEALAATRGNGEGWYDAELYRLKGELTSQFTVQGSKLPDLNARHPTPATLAEAEGYFLKAIEIARGQEAKSLELRAAMSLTRLWRQQGKSQEAQPLLQQIYGWFREGFDTADLKEAKALLDELRVSAVGASRTRGKRTAIKSTKRKSQ